MTVTMTLEDLLRLAQNDLDNNPYEVRDFYSEYYPGEPINNGAIVAFLLDQFKQMWEMKGITLKVI